MKLHEKRDENLQNFEKSFGDRLKKMTDDSEVPISSANVDEVFKADAEQFSTQIRHQFMEYRSTFRNVINRVREKEFDTFAKINLEKKPK